MRWSEKKAALLAAMENNEACRESRDCMERAKSLKHFLKLFGKARAVDWVIGLYRDEVAGFLQEHYPFVAAGLLVVETPNYSSVTYELDSIRVECSYWMHYDLAWKKTYKLMTQKDGVAFLAKLLLSGAKPQ